MTKRKKTGKPHVLLLGSPSAGKDHWARAYAKEHQGWSLEQEWRPAYESAKLPVPEMGQRTMRAPHHTVSLWGMLGQLRQGWVFRPGEMTLAHGGVLYLSDVNEFRREVIAAVEGCLHSGSVKHSHPYRSVNELGEPEEWTTTIAVPARFTLVASATRCPCGFFPAAVCRCTAGQVSRWLERLQWLEPWCRVLEIEGAEAVREHGSLKELM
jgi:magnesium chelatase family protein